MRHLHLATCLAAFGLLPLLSGCASLPLFSSGAEAEQAKLMREHQERRAAAEATATSPVPLSLKERLRNGDTLRSDGAYAGAMWNYLRAHELDPADPAPIARMASLHLMSGSEEAESIFLDLVEKQPESGAAHTGLGLARIERNDWVGARDSLMHAVSLSPRSAAAYSALGVCHDRLGEPDAAREAYLRATTLHPRYYEALNNLGVSYLTTGEFDSAARTLRRASQQQGRDPAVFNNLGLALGRMERYDDALEAFQQGGSEQAARNNLGFVLYLNGSYDRALEEYERALLAGGDQRLMVLRNFQAAKRAEEERGSTP